MPTRRVEVSEQVRDFLRSLAPEPRHRISHALRGLPEGKGDIKKLQGAFQGYSRLRVGVYRVVFRRELVKGEEVVRCDFAERRSVVYGQFAPPHK